MNLALIETTALASLGELFGKNMQQLVPLGLALIALIFMMMSLRRKQQQPRQSRRPIGPEHNQDVPQATPELRRDMDELLVELQDLSRKISAEIDTRFAKLEAAIRDADRRIAVLHRLSRETGHDRTPVSSADLHEDARHAVVYELADAGFTPVDIARELGKTPGEVELIINLRRRPEPAKPG